MHTGLTVCKRVYMIQNLINKMNICLEKSACTVKAMEQDDV